MARRLELTPEERQAREREQAKLRQQKLRSRRRGTPLPVTSLNVTPAGPGVTPAGELADVMVAEGVAATPSSAANGRVLPKFDLHRQIVPLVAPGLTFTETAAKLQISPQQFEAVLADLGTTWDAVERLGREFGSADRKIGAQRKAAAGDPRFLGTVADDEIGSLSAEDRWAVLQHRKLLAMSDEELRAMRAKFAAVVDAPKYAGFSGTPLPPTVRVSEPGEVPAAPAVPLGGAQALPPEGGKSVVPVAPVVSAPLPVPERPRGPVIAHPVYALPGPATPANETAMSELIRDWRRSV